MKFADIVGQNETKAWLLETSKAGRISHAQLFLGKGVVGKFALALAYAQYINCSNKQAYDACGTCPSCVKYNQLSHPDLYFSFPVNTGHVKDSSKNLICPMFNNYWVEYLKESRFYPQLQTWYKKIGMSSQQGRINVGEARRIVQDMSYKPVESSYKVLIIWQADKMNIQAANLLLKFFEEPPKHTLIFMISDEKDKLLPTVLSRFQTVEVPKIASFDLLNYAKKNYPKSTETELKSLVKLAHGDLYKLQQLVEAQSEMEQYFVMFQTWMRMCYKKGSLEEIKGFVENISKLSKEAQKQFLRYALDMIRACLLINYGHPALQQLNTYEAEWLNNFAPFVHINNAIPMSTKIEASITELERNANAAVLFTNLSLHISQWLKISQE